jgi:hypothetical protein
VICKFARYLALLTLQRISLSRPFGNIDNLHGKLLEGCFFLSLKLNSKGSFKDALLQARLVHA